VGVTSLLLACRYFNLTQPVRVATANLYKRSNKLSCILYSVCLFFLTKQYGQILLTAMKSYPFFIIFGAKRPAKLCSLIIRTGSKQKYRHFRDGGMSILNVCLLLFLECIQYAYFAANDKIIWFCRLFLIICRRYGII